MVGARRRRPWDEELNSFVTPFGAEEPTSSTDRQTLVVHSTIPDISLPTVTHPTALPFHPQEKPSKGIFSYIDP